MDGGCADTGLDNIKVHIGQEEPNNRVLNQTKEPGLYLVDIESYKGHKVTLINYTSIKLKKSREARRSNLHFRKIILAAMWLMDLKKPNLRKKEKLEDY